MISQPNPPSARVAAWVGMIGLASAMGIGRFSLTPILPLMEHDLGVTLAQGSWLAGANYLGYLIGAVICMSAPPRPTLAIRAGLAGCAAFTLAMGLGNSMPLWIIWRLLAGVASAFVLVGVSAWTIPILVCSRKDEWSGRVFSGVGIGIAFAGMVGLISGVAELSSPTTWLLIGSIAVVVAVAFWLLLAGSVDGDPSRQLRPAPGHQDRHKRRRRPLPRRGLIAAICYAAFGYGYIIPATYLPAVARSYIDDPRLFGLIWPVFGAAAAMSTVVASGRRATPRQMWARAQWLLTAGVVMPVIAINMWTLSVAALCVGGSFMIITMSGIQEALQSGDADPSRLVGMMTAGFALGQIAGPVTVALLSQSSHALALSSLIAVAALIASNCMLAAGFGTSVGASVVQHSAGDP
jgi:MFS family permease